MGSKSPVRERSHAGFHNGRQHDASTRPKQLRDREVPWEGSLRSKLMSRRTERPYKVDGAGELARQSAARCSTPKINGPVVQQQFTSTCSKETIVAIATTKKQVRATNACQRNNNGRTPKFQFYRGHFMDKIQKSRMHNSQRRALTNGDGVKAMVFFCLASVLADANVSAASPD